MQYWYKSSHLSPTYRQMDVDWLAEYTQIASGGLGRYIIHCHIAIIYGWQQRYDQRCDRVNRIPKGHWQGLGEGFITADFIDVLQSCLCVNVFVCVWVRVVSQSRDSEWRLKEGHGNKDEEIPQYVDSEPSEPLVFTGTVMMFPWWLKMCVLVCVPLRV